MESSSLSGVGSLAASLNKATFGAQVVSKTLDYMNSGGGSSSGLAPTDKQTFGAAVVGKTLDYMNAGSKRSGGMGGMSQTYQFNKDVLGAYMGGKGLTVNMEV